MDEAKLIEKLNRIEALFAGASTDGERVAATEARRRSQLRWSGLEKEDLPIEYRFTLEDAWSHRVLVALLRRYGIHPYRYRGQRHTTVMARVSKRLVDEPLWPGFEQIDMTLHRYLEEVTERIISEVIHRDESDVEEISEPPRLPTGKGR